MGMTDWKEEVINVRKELHKLYDFVNSRDNKEIKEFMDLEETK